jgi:hypothetical protein
MFVPLKTVFFSYGQRFSACFILGTVSLSLSAVVAWQRTLPNDVRRIQMIQNHYRNWPFLSHCLNPSGPGGLFNYTLRQCDQNERPLFDKSSRVAIVGGGPSGILMAKLLHDRGFKHLTLFEKEGRVGGKSKSLLLDSGEKVDLGTIFTFNKYECVELLADQVNITERPVNPDNKTARLVSSKNSTLVNMTPPHFGNEDDWFAEYALSKYGVTLSEYGATLVANIKSYIDLWAETMGSFEYMFPDKETVNFDALNQTFLSWLENHSLYALIPRLIVLTSGAGYGNLETIPAFYGLMWNHPNYFGGNGTLSMLLEDFQTMFERILNTTETTIKLKAEIVKIDRQGKGVVIDYIEGSPASQGKTREHFDFLIMAAPMPTALKMLEYPTDVELELFDKYNYKSVRYDIIYLESTGNVDPFNLFTWMDRLDQQTDFHVASFNEDGDTEMHILTRDGIDGALTMARIGRIDAGIGFDEDGDFSRSAGIFSISPFDVTQETVRKYLKADLDEYEMNVTFIHTEIWPNYQPWKNLTQVVDEKMPWRIYDAQGKESFPKTWYIGSYVSFESVPDVLDYNIKMVNEKLCVQSEDTKGKSSKKHKSGKDKEKLGIFDL